MGSVGSGLPREIRRLRKAKEIYRDLPNGVGLIAMGLIEIELRKAEEALSSGDVIRIVQAYAALKESCPDIGHDD